MDAVRLIASELQKTYQCKYIVKPIKKSIIYNFYPTNIYLYQLFILIEQYNVYELNLLIESSTAIYVLIRPTLLI